MKVLNILGIVAGGITSITIIVVGIKKIISWIIKKNKDQETIDQMAIESEKNKAQETIIKEIKEQLLILSNTVNNMQINISKRFDKIDSQMLLERNLLINDARYVLESTMRASIDRGWVTVEEKMLIGDLFAAYIDAGGNHGISDLFKTSYKDLQTKPKQNVS